MANPRGKSKLTRSHLRTQPLFRYILVHVAQKQNGNCIDCLEVTFKNVWFRFSTCTKYKQQRFSVLAFVQLIYFLLQSLYICKFFHPSKRRSWSSKGTYCAQFEAVVLKTWLRPFVTLNVWRVTEKNIILKKLPCVL